MRLASMGVNEKGCSVSEPMSSALVQAGSSAVRKISARAMPYWVTPSISDAFNQLTRWLFDPAVGLALISGPKGVGKSRFLSAFIEQCCHVPQAHDGVSIRFCPIFLTMEALLDIASLPSLVKHIDLLIHQVQLKDAYVVQAQACNASPIKEAEPAVREWYVLVVDHAAELPSETLGLLVMHALMSRPQVCLTILADGPRLLAQVREHVARVQHLRRQLQVLDVPALSRQESDDFVRKLLEHWGISQQWSEKRLQAAFAESLGMPGQLVTITQRLLSLGEAGPESLSGLEPRTPELLFGDAEPSMRKDDAEPSVQVQHPEDNNGYGKYWWLIVFGLLLSFVFSVWLLLGQMGLVAPPVTLNLKAINALVVRHITPHLRSYFEGQSYFTGAYQEEGAVCVVETQVTANHSPLQFGAYFVMQQRFEFRAFAAPSDSRWAGQKLFPQIQPSFSPRFGAVGYDLREAMASLFSWQPAAYVVQIDADIDLHQLKDRWQLQSTHEDLPRLIVPTKHRGVSGWIMVVGPFPDHQAVSAAQARVLGTFGVSGKGWVRRVRDLQQSVLRLRQGSLAAGLQRVS